MSGANDAERLLLLELVVDPPTQGDTPDQLAARLQMSLGTIDRAAEALVGSGLAVRRR